MQAGPVFALLLAVIAIAAGTGQRIALSPERSGPQDLELSGDLPGLPKGAVRFVSYAELASLPQRRFTVRDDANFPYGAELSGVSLDDLIHRLGLADSGQLVAAVCDDKYEAHYPAEYRVAHSPILVLRIDGKPAAEWPKADGSSYGPFLISHARFTPAFHILSHTDEPQIPYGVLELKFLPQDEVLNALLPSAKYPMDSPVMQGYRIAFQNCFRCHNEGAFGGQKAGVDWETLAGVATGDPASFAATIHDPRARYASASMPGNPQYDTQTLHALTAYFQAFHRRGNR